MSHSFFITYEDIRLEPCNKCNKGVMLFKKDRHFKISTDEQIGESCEFICSNCYRVDKVFTNLNLDNLGGGEIVN